MDPELWDVIKRYTLVGVVLVTASIWTVIYSTDATRKANNAPAFEARTAPEALDAGPLVDDAAVEGAVLRHGLRRVLCEAACSVEARCGLRTKDVCVNESCDGDVRKLNKSDFGLVKAATCDEVAATPCEEACWRQGECKDDHTSDEACSAGCRALMQSQPAQTWVQARCILETKSCEAVALCRGN